MNVEEYERRLRDLTMGAEERLFEGVEPMCQRLYRRLVRANLFGAVRRALPITRRLLGDESTDRLIASFLDLGPGPQTRALRRVALEVGEWLMTQPQLVPSGAVAELVHWEALEVEVALAPEYDGPALSREPGDDAELEAHPSARLAAYRHPVHRLTRESAGYPAASEEPAILLAWRVDERVTWRSLDGAVAKLLVEAANGATIARCFDAVEATLRPGEALDRRRVKAALVDLCRRGALVGFRAATA